jgi:hypothetical protein
MKLRVHLFLVLLVGLVTLTCYQGVLANSSDVSGQEIVNIEIDGNRFAIPKGYMWYEGAWKGGKVSGVNLWALLPDMQPRTENNKSEFDGPGGYRGVVGILLSRINKAVSSQEGAGWPAKRKRLSFDWKVKEFTQGPSFDGPYGFKMYKGNKIAAWGELLFRTMPDDSLYFIACDQDGGVPFPSCSAEVYLSDKLYVRYTFGKPYLKDWQVIDQKVRQLIHSFEIKKTSKIQGD